MKTPKPPRKTTSGELGLALAKEVARIRGGLPSSQIDLGLLNEVVAHLVSGQFEPDED